MPEAAVKHMLIVEQVPVLDESQQQSLVQLATEYGLNVFFAGHYATETVGLRALADVMRDDTA